MLKKKIISAAGTVLIFALLVSLVCLTFVYMFSFQTRNELKFGASDMNALEQDFAAAGYVDEVGTETIMPVFVGVSNENGRVGAFSGDALKGLYNSAFEIAKEYLIRGKIETLEQEDLESASDIAKDGAFIYIKYSVAYPKSVIVNFSDRETFTLSISDEYIREIFVFYDKTEREVRVLALSPDAGYLYTGDFGFSAGFNNKIKNEYNNADGTFDFLFASEMEGSALVSSEKISSSVYGNTIVPVSEISLCGVSYYSKYELMISDGVYGKILSAFMLNPEKASAFTDSDGTRTYFEEGKNVHIRKDGTVEYSSVGSYTGINIGDIIGYHAENEAYSLRDKIGATLIIAKKIAVAAEFSPKTSVRLSEIHYDEEKNLVISYELTYDSLSVAAEKNVFSFTVSTDSIKRAEAGIFGISELYYSEPLPDMKWNIIAYAAAGGEYTDFCPAYVVGINKDTSYAE
ncbi:MAG: hypothetical protein ACI4QR_01170, partial [Eubacteriales bacterium]